MRGTPILRRIGGNATIDFLNANGVGLRGWVDSMFSINGWLDARL